MVIQCVQSLLRNVWVSEKPHNHPKGFWSKPIVLKYQESGIRICMWITQTLGMRFYTNTKYPTNTLAVVEETIDLRVPKPFLSFPSKNVEMMTLAQMKDKAHDHRFFSWERDTSTRVTKSLAVNHKRLQHMMCLPEKAHWSPLTAKGWSLYGFATHGNCRQTVGHTYNSHPVCFREFDLPKMHNLDTQLYRVHQSNAHTCVLPNAQKAPSSLIVSHKKGFMLCICRHTTALAPTTVMWNSFPFFKKNRIRLHRNLDARS